MGRILQGFFRTYTILLILHMAGIQGAESHEFLFIPAVGLDPSADLIMKSDAEVQGIVSAFDWDSEKLEGRDLDPAAALDLADLVIRRVEPDYMILGVVINTDDIGQETIPPGTTTIATARFRCKQLQDTEVPVDLVFQDGKYGTTSLGPLLDNMITVGGLTISKEEGLVLTSGTVTCAEVQPEGRLRIRNATAEADSPCKPVDILLDNSTPVEGFILSVAHEAESIRLDEISVLDTVTDSNGAEFVSSNIFSDGGILQVIMDFEVPLQGKAIPPGNGQVIARYAYCCLGGLNPGDPDKVTPLNFVDGVYGDPPVDNVLFVGGDQEKPELISGTFACRAPRGERPQEFHCGPAIDPVTGDLPPIVGFPGSTVKVAFYYRSLPKGTSGDTGEDRIQALSMAICFSPQFVQCREESFSIEGSITEAVGAEFVRHHAENNADDGDPGELVIGILIDALPPFDGQTLPPTIELLRIATIDFAIAPDAPCDQCLPVEFCPGADGRGDVWIRNLMTVNNQSVKPDFFNCDICVNAVPKFVRGDCNFSSSGGLGVTIADAAAIVSFLFHKKSEPFQPPCLDACDGNDDGLVDLADAVYVLRYLFLSGKEPPPPGPKLPGADPTPDQLDCKAGSICP